MAVEPLRLEGTDEFVKNLSNEVRKISLKSSVALEAGGLIIMAQAIEYTPVDTGNLINSRYQQVLGKGTANPSIEFGYTAEYAPAVHEATGATFQKPGARAQFLLAALLEKGNEALAEIRRIVNVENQQAI